MGKVINQILFSDKDYQQAVNRLRKGKPAYAYDKHDKRTRLVFKDGRLFEPETGRFVHNAKDFSDSINREVEQFWDDWNRI